MDAKKTGVLIAQARHHLNMTQKELAERLHVSDRAVSKWERGAGFPDVSLLEPLAQALELTAAELLRGEKAEEETVNTGEVIRDAVKLARKQLWGSIRRNLAAILLVIGLAAFFLPATGLWSWLTTRTTEIDCVVPAYVYTLAGERTGEETEVTVQGKWRERRVLRPDQKAQWYIGRFAIGCVEKTCRDGAEVMIERDADDYGNMRAQSISLFYAGDTDIKTFRLGCYASPGMQHFAVMTVDGRIIATHDYLAELMALYPNIYSLDHLGLSIMRVHGVDG